MLQYPLVCVPVLLLAGVEFESVRAFAGRGGGFEQSGY